MFRGTVVFGESANEATRLGCGRKTTDARVVEGGFIFSIFPVFFPRVSVWQWRPPVGFDESQEQCHIHEGKYYTDL